MLMASDTFKNILIHKIQLKISVLQYVRYKKEASRGIKALSNYTDIYITFLSILPSNI